MAQRNSTRSARSHLKQRPMTTNNDFAVCGSVWQRPAVQAAFEGGPVQDHLTRRDGPPSE
jgi:hypothetical protein